MTDPAAEPDWTRRCKGLHLLDLAGQPHMLRESDDPESAWRSVLVTHDCMFSDPEIGGRIEYLTVDFHGGGERLINESDDIEVGFIRPPWWPESQEPPEWP